MNHDPTVVFQGWQATEWKRIRDCTIDKWPNVTIGLMVSPFYDGERYAVRDGHGQCLNSYGEWESEPMPSSRDDVFYERCRFRSLGAAIIAAETALHSQEQAS